MIKLIWFWREKGKFRKKNELLPMIISPQKSCINLHTFTLPSINLQLYVYLPEIKPKPKRTKMVFEQSPQCVRNAVGAAVFIKGLVVRKTDRGSLSTWIYVLTFIIYLVATMTTAGWPWCAGRLDCSDGIILQDDTSSVLQKTAREPEPLGETRYSNNAAWNFEELFIRRLSTEGGGKWSLACFLSPSKTLI